ncbi:MAG: hypothetical protein M0Z87_07790 [Actinomycetota bacterium]|nr:hypothetical protein [Actinomycetota bacterium]
MSAIFVAVVLVVLLSFVVTLWALIDAIRTPATSFVGVGPKALWIGLLAAGLIFAVVPGALVGVLYLALVRPRLAHRI